MSKFQKIKAQVEEEKSKKVRGEARKSSLQEEKERIFATIQEEVGSELDSSEKIEQYSNELKEGIEKDIVEMAKILEEEGIEV